MCLLPFGVDTFTLCRFGLNCRRAMPVTLVPTPPKYFFLPRVVTRFPNWAVFPQVAHCRAIARSSQLPQPNSETVSLPASPNPDNAQNAGPLITHLAMGLPLHD